LSKKKKGLACRMGLPVLMLALAAPVSQAAAAPRNDEVVQIEVYMSRDGFHAGEAVVFALVAEIAAGWHIHDPEPADMFLIPTEIQLDESENFNLKTIHYPETVNEKYEYSDSELAVYLGKVAFGLMLEMKPGLAEGEHTLTGAFKFQACDHSSCLPPKSIPYTVTIHLVPDSQETRTLHPEIFEKIRFEDERK